MSALSLAVVRGLLRRSSTRAAGYARSACIAGAQATRTLARGRFRPAVIASDYADPQYADASADPQPKGVDLRGSVDVGRSVALPSDEDLDALADEYEQAMEGVISDGANRADAVWADNARPFLVVFNRLKAAIRAAASFASASCWLVSTTGGEPTADPKPEMVLRSVGRASASTDGLRDIASAISSAEIDRARDASRGESCGVASATPPTLPSSASVAPTRAPVD